MSEWHPITRRIRNKLSRNAWGLSEMQCKLIEEIAGDMENKIKAEGIREMVSLFSAEFGMTDDYNDLLSHTTSKILGYADKLEKGDE